VLLPRQQAKLARGAKDKEHAMSQIPNTAIAVIGIYIGKKSLHVVGHDARGAIVLRSASAAEHPLQNNTTEELHAWADEAIDEILGAICVASNDVSEKKVA
jgi:hypothetical protein